MKIFGDYIDSKIFFKKLRKFTDEEKVLVDNIFNSILHQDKNSEIITIYNKEIFENSEFISDVVSKKFTLEGHPIELEIRKHYCDEKKMIKDERYIGGSQLIHTPISTWISSGSEKYTDLFDKNMKANMNIDRIIFITCKANISLKHDKNDKRDFDACLNSTSPILFNGEFSKDATCFHYHGYPSETIMGIITDYDQNNSLTTEVIEKFKIFEDNICDRLLKAIEPKNLDIYYND